MKIFGVEGPLPSSMESCISKGKIKFCVNVCMMMIFR
jgi:hypothetical protein